MNQREARQPSPRAVQARARLRPWRGRRGAGGGSVIAPLVVVMTLALLALMFPFALMAPHVRIAETLQSLQLRSSTRRRRMPSGPAAMSAHRTATVATSCCVTACTAATGSATRRCWRRSPANETGARQRSRRIVSR
ncbi:hypothetical protein [Nevskia sp.]|uniref:hypothetical protein n=1 Tax=Nevskia sp. TaxID=1929292 RepID=UPI003F705427